jgi:ribonuclease E
MADWRQIQARIRRAKASHDPLGQLTTLFEKFKDAMVAYELGVLEEAAGAREKAVHWYGIAAERFRRADWKRKAQAALERLSGLGTGEIAGANSYSPTELSGKSEAASGPPSAGGITLAASDASVAKSLPELEPVPSPKKKRRRGRRGGRRRRERREAARTATKSGSVQVTSAVVSPLPTESTGVAPAAAPTPAGEPEPSQFELRYRTRTGEPALASRIARLESKLRQLTAGPPLPLTLETADQAPVGPGVLLVSDADQTTHYYAEACDSLRAGIEQWLRSSRAGRHARRAKELRARLAEHLGISESKVTDYLKKHCTVRWLQLDEGAANLAHFAIAVLQPVLNE